MTFYYFSEKRKKGTDAGPKARNDVDTILSTKYTPLYPYIDASKIKQAYKMLSTLRQIKKKDFVFIQYPPLDEYCWMLKYFPIPFNAIFIIHDLPFLRYGGKSELDYYYLHKAKFFLSHNKYMSNYLEKIGISSSNIVNLNIFDYLTNEDVKDFTPDADLCFAGNLVKSPFLYNLPKNFSSIKFNVYGPSLKATSSRDLFNYCGVFEPDAIIHNLDGKFGLIWDGPSSESCTGPLGEYMKYNNPHKFSMYLAANIPVIVWEKSAISSFVKKYNIGFCISSLSEIPQIIDNLNDADYKAIKENTSIIGNRIRHGYYLNFSLELIEKKILNKLN